MTTTDARRLHPGDYVWCAGELCRIAGILCSLDEETFWLCRQNGTRVAAPAAALAPVRGLRHGA